MLHNVAIRRQMHCWQEVLWDFAAVLAFLRRTFALAAVLAVQLALIWRPLGIHLASTWRPIGAQRVPSWPRRRPRGLSAAEEAPRRLQDESQRRPRGAKWSPRGAQEVPSGARKSSRRAPRDAKKQSNTVWRAQRAIFEKVPKVSYSRAKIEVQGALEKPLDAKWRSRMASKCALTAQLGAQVQLDSPTWQHKSNLEPNLAAKCAF